MAYILNIVITNQLTIIQIVDILLIKTNNRKEKFKMKYLENYQEERKSIVSTRSTATKATIKPSTHFSRNQKQKLIK